MKTKPPFDVIVEKHGSTVLRVCRAVLGGVADAEDAWSETFLAALRAYPQLADDANVEAWLVTIAHRKAIDVVRSANRRAVPVESVPDRDPAVRGVDADDAHEVWSAVAGLPNKQRLAVAYHYFGGMPYREIADVVGGTAAAARRAAADGIASLRITLADPLPEGVNR